MGERGRVSTVSRLELRLVSHESQSSLTYNEPRLTCAPFPPTRPLINKRSSNDSTNCFSALIGAIVFGLSLATNSLNVEVSVSTE